MRLDGKVRMDLLEGLMDQGAPQSELLRVSASQFIWSSRPLPSARTQTPRQLPPGFFMSPVQRRARKAARWNAIPPLWSGQGFDFLNCINATG